MSAPSSLFLVSEAQLQIEKDRVDKAKRLKEVGEPIKLSGVALAITVSDGHAWIGENTFTAKKVALESGDVLKTFKGHTGPVSALALYKQSSVLITGSWDKTIKVWDAETTNLLSSTESHSDFVKSLLVLETPRLLISGSSDKIVRLWNLPASPTDAPLTSAGSISAHTRPVECLDAQVVSETSIQLCTGDTMGAIKLWTLERDPSDPCRWRNSLQKEFNHHRTRINELYFRDGLLWTASADETVQVVPITPSPQQKPMPPITHPTAVRAALPLSLTDLAEPYVITGSAYTIRAYDVSSPDEPELLKEVEGHAHEVTALRLWMRRFTGEDGLNRIEPWVVSTGLDGIIRKWKLIDLLMPTPVKDTMKEKPEEKPVNIQASAAPGKDAFEISEEEERELAELMGDD